MSDAVYPDLAGVALGTVKNAELVFVEKKQIDVLIVSGNPGDVLIVDVQPKSLVLATPVSDVLVVQPPAEKMILTIGEQGPPGPQGAIGATGPAGAGDANFVFSQQVPLASWIVQHGLNKYPAIAVVDTAGSVVIADLAYTSLNVVTITMASPMSGIAYCN